MYPRYVNLSSRSGARNISIRVELMDSHEHPVHSLFGKSSCTAISSSVNTSVSYHIKLDFYY